MRGLDLIFFELIYNFFAKFKFFPNKFKKFKFIFIKNNEIKKKIQMLYPIN